MRNVVILKGRIYTLEKGQMRFWRSSQTDKEAEDRHLSEIGFKEGIKKGTPALVFTRSERVAEFLPK